MSGRTFVVIFVFWAFLAIITPTLVLLSETSKPFLNVNGEMGEGSKSRRMKGYKEKSTITPPTAQPVLSDAPSPAPSPSPPPPPKPLPNPAIGSSKALYRKLFCDPVRAVIKKALRSS